VADIVTSGCGLKIPLTTPEEVIVDLREAILTCIRDRAGLRQLAIRAPARARDFLWARNGEEMAKIYAAVCQKKV
jgi:hypothetical protein